MKDFKVHASQMFLLRISVIKLNWQQMKTFSASQIFLLRKISVFLIKTSEQLSSFMFISLHFYDTNLYLFLSEASQAKLMLLVNNNYSIKSPVQWDRETCQNKSRWRKRIWWLLWGILYIAVVWYVYISWMFLQSFSYLNVSLCSYLGARLSHKYLAFSPFNPQSRKSLTVFLFYFCPKVECAFLRQELKHL